MSKLRLLAGTTYTIVDYATPNSFTILLASMSVSDVLKTFTEENLSKIQFLTDNGKITGIYHNKLLCGYIEHGNTLEISINDVDLCRYGLILDEDSRIIDTPVQRYAPSNVIIVDKLPYGDSHDYLYINGEFIYDPLPKPEPVEPTPEPTVWDELDTAYQSGYEDGYKEGVNSAYDQ